MLQRKRLMRDKSSTIRDATVETVDGAELGRVVHHDASVIEVRGADGRIWRFPPSALQSVGGAHDRLRLVRAVEELVIPIAAERLHVGRQVVESERLRVHIGATTREQEVPATTVTHEELDVERVRCDREVADAPRVREEGDTVVIPVVEEVLVVRKALMLREEVRVRRRRVERQQPATRVALRSEHAEISSVPGGARDSVPSRA